MFYMLQHLLAQAAYDDALDLVGENPRQVIQGDSLERLHRACMVSDVLDYGGRYAGANDIIHAAGEAAWKRLSTLSKEDLSFLDIAEATFLKQQCWALLMWGMCAYRREDYTESLARFYLANKVLRLLRDCVFKDAHDPSKEVRISVTGSRSRAYYCIGLVHRQNKTYAAARAAFGKSVDLAGIGIAQRSVAGKPITAYDYHMARCYGLGIGFIAYDDAFLDEARSALVIARRLLIDKKVRFIRAYVEVIHACMQMSLDAGDVRYIDRAIDLLKKAYSVLTEPQHSGHASYAIRASTELAQAYLRRGRLVSGEEKISAFNTAEGYLARVTTEAVKTSDPRTYCAGLIIRSRVARARGNPSEALDFAKDAKAAAEGVSSCVLTFSQIDAAITLGESYYETGDYSAAARELLHGLDLGGSSRKVAAVCHLHLARTYKACDCPSKALEHFQAYESLEPGLQNWFVASLAKRVREEIGTLVSSFRISPDVVDLRANVHLRNLRRWLAVTALKRTEDDAVRAGTLLEKDAKTVKDWAANKDSSAASA
jgi:tetratricopeptide (TPR) repeat protein